MSDDKDMVTFHIPAKLAEEFDKFVELSCFSISSNGNRDDWSDEERAIFDWMDKGNYKTKGEPHAKH
jgi:hypothetical protein